MVELVVYLPEGSLQLWDVPSNKCLFRAPGCRGLPADVLGLQRL
jgi:hypothetical protein